MKQLEIYFKDNGNPVVSKHSFERTDDFTYTCENGIVEFKSRGFTFFAINRKKFSYFKWTKTI